MAAAEYPNSAHLEMHSSGVRVSIISKKLGKVRCWAPSVTHPEYFQPVGRVAFCTVGTGTVEKFALVEYTDILFASPHASVGAPPHGIPHWVSEAATAPPFTMLLPQKHCDVYCNPAMEKPSRLQVAIHDSTVMVLLSGWPLDKIRPLALSLYTK
jgi:hypothetical protein